MNNFIFYRYFAQKSTLAKNDEIYRHATPGMIQSLLGEN